MANGTKQQVRTQRLPVKMNPQKPMKNNPMEKKKKKNLMEPMKKKPMQKKPTNGGRSGDGFDLYQEKRGEMGPRGFAERERDMGPDQRRE